MNLNWRPDEGTIQPFLVSSKTEVTMKNSPLRSSLLLVIVLAVGVCAHGQSASAANSKAEVPITSAQGTSTPVPNPTLQFSLWQQTSQSTAASADPETQFKVWQSQRTSADSINLFKCTTSTDLDNPECVGRLPGTKVTGTKEAKIPTTFPVRKSKTGEPD